MKILKNDIHKRNFNPIYIDLFLGFHRYGLPNIFRYDRLFTNLYILSKHDTSFILYVPANFSFSKAVHKTLLHFHIASIIYANRFEIKKIVPFIDMKFMTSIHAKNNYKHVFKTTYPIISYLFLIRKDITYNIDCLHRINNFSHAQSDAINRNIVYYIENITGKECVKRFVSRATFRKWTISQIKKGILSDTKINWA